MRALRKKGASIVFLAVGALAAAVPADAFSPADLKSAVSAEFPLQTVQYYWGGYNYCWYPDGWHGPGYYWCGYAWRYGLGWGGPWGWHGWRWGGALPRGWRGGGWHGPRMAWAATGTAEVFMTEVFMAAVMAEDRA